MTRNMLNKHHGHKHEQRKKEIDDPQTSNMPNGIYGDSGDLSPLILTLSSTGQGTFHLEFLLNHILSADFFSKLSKLIWR